MDNFDKILSQRGLITNYLFVKRTLTPRYISDNWQRILKTTIPCAFWFLMFSAIFPFHRYKLGYFHTDRVGHFVMDSAIRFAETGGKKRSREIYWIDSSEAASNEFWLALLRRNFRITTSSILGCVISFASGLPAKPKWYVAPKRDTHGSRDSDGSIANSTFEMQFTDDEHKAGRDWLASVGCFPGQPFVCLMVRDSEYLNADSLHSPNLHNREKDFWSYHNYRNSDISSFLPAAEWLAAQGVFVIRMGKKMAQEFLCDRDEVIDYAFRKDRSDFLDVWLFANCSLCVTTGTGPDAISEAFRRPTVYVNFLPPTHAWTSGQSLTAPKALYGPKGERLSFEKSMEVDFGTSEDYSAAGIKIRDLSPDEILQVVREGWGRINGVWKDTDADKSRQEEFHIAIKNSKARRYHKYLHPEARLSSAWLDNLKREIEVAGSGDLT